MIARLVLAAASVACALYLAYGGYAIGLDFEGGVHVVVRAPAGDADARAELEHAIGAAKIESSADTYAIEIAGGDDHDAAAVIGELPPGFQVEAKHVIHPVLDPALGRRFATYLAAVAALAWLAGFAIRRGSLAMVATLALAAAAAVVELVHGGGTLSRATYIAAFELALPASLAVALAAGRRATAAVPGLVLLGLVLAASIVAAAIGGSTHAAWQPYLVALRVAWRAAPAAIAVVVAALAAVADLLPGSRAAA
ncbi:MAG TPA: hypothetical protein VGF94_10675 [Kofleriaceae bacterium]|jgi:hypothetical protein